VNRPANPDEETEEFGGVVEIAPPAERRRWPLRAQSRIGLLIGAAVAAVAAIILIPSVKGPIGISGGGGLICGTAEAAVLTRHGDIRQVHLSDGSMMTLDSDTKVVCEITASARRARLVRGRARFTLKADPRPFSVTAGAGSLEAKSGTFDVALDKQGRASIHVLSGTAEVHPLGQNGSEAGKARTIAAGEQFTYRSDAYDGRPVAAEGQNMDESQWPSGWVEARSISLAALVEEANRYSAAPIIIDDPELGGIEVTGRYKVADTESFLSRLAELLDLRVDRRPDGIHLRRDDFGNTD
jgi:transmembrane sensor